MSAAAFAMGAILMLGMALLPESEARDSVGLLGVGCILAASLLRERAP